MNKIYNAFSNITVSDELKEKTYQKIIEHSNPKRSKKIYLFRLSLAVTSIIICIFIYSINKDKNIDLNKEAEIDTFNAVDTSIEDSNYIIYNDTKYILDSSIIIEDNMLEEKIGVINREASINIESNSQDNTSIYSIKNIDEKLQIAIVTDNEILVFVVEK